MMIETNRLYLYPLSSKELKMAVNHFDKLLKKKKLNAIVKDLSLSMKEIYKIKYENSKYNKKLINYYTYFWIIDKESKTFMGEIGFKGIPNHKGEVEVGYGLFEDYQKKGFMTEALNGIVKWAISEDRIRFIIAKTAVLNEASQKVLIKCNFSKVPSDDVFLMFKRGNAKKLKRHIWYGFFNMRLPEENDLEELNIEDKEMTKSCLENAFSNNQEVLYVMTFFKKIISIAWYDDENASIYINVYSNIFRKSINKITSIVLRRYLESEYKIFFDIKDRYICS